MSPEHDGRTSSDGPRDGLGLGRRALPDRRAVGGPRPQLTYAEWDARTDRLARRADRGRGARPATGWPWCSTGGEPLARCTSRAQKLGAVVGAAVHPVRPDGAGATAWTTPPPCSSSASPPPPRRRRPRSPTSDPSRDRTSTSTSSSAGPPIAPTPPRSPAPGRGRPQRHALHVRHHRAGRRACRARHRAEHAAAVAHAVQTRPAQRRGGARRDAAVPHDGPAHAAAPASSSAARGWPSPRSTPARPLELIAGERRHARSTSCRRCTGRCCAPAASAEARGRPRSSPTRARR